MVRENQVIHVEDLNIVGMVKNRRLAQAISDAGWGQFVRIIGEKADRYGRTVHTVSRWLASSKTCLFDRTNSGIPRMNGRVGRWLVCSSRGMAISDEVERDLSTIVLPKWGCVRADDGPPPLLVVDDGDEAIEPIRRYLRDLVSRGRSSSSVRSYADDLLRWWRWLRVIDVEWNKATAVDVKDFVLWLLLRRSRQFLPRSRHARPARSIR